MSSSSRSSWRLAYTNGGRSSSLQGEAPMERALKKGAVPTSPNWKSSSDNVAARCPCLMARPRCPHPGSAPPVGGPVCMHLVGGEPGAPAAQGMAGADGKDRECARLCAFATSPAATPAPDDARAAAAPRTRLCAGLARARARDALRCPAPAASAWGDAGAACMPPSRGTGHGTRACCLCPSQPGCGGGRRHEEPTKGGSTAPSREPVPCRLLTPPAVCLHPDQGDPPQ